MAIAPTVTTFNPSANNANFRIAVGTDAGNDITASLDPAGALSNAGVQIVGTSTMATIGDDACVQAVFDSRF